MLQRLSALYVVWKWSYADVKVPADESFKLSLTLGLDTDGNSTIKPEKAPTAVDIASLP